MVKIAYELKNDGTPIVDIVSADPEVNFDNKARAYVSGRDVVVEARADDIKAGTKRHFELEIGQSGTIYLTNPTLTITVKAVD